MRERLPLLFAILLASFTLALPTAAQDVQGNVYVEASVSKTDPYIGEQITYQFVLYDAVGLTNPLYQPSDFEGFWRIDMGIVSQTTAQLNGRQYTVTTIATALYATQLGDVTIMPSSVVLPETVFRSKTTLTANPIGINVRSLPEGKPADYGGAVGQFNVAASLDRPTVNVGEPITLSLTISGTGNVEQLPPPSVPQNWRTTVTAGAYSNEIQNGIVVGKRDYQLVFFPTSAGQQELPSITLDYFDPNALAYRSVSTSPVKIEVLSDAITSTQQPLVLSEPSLRLKPLGELMSNRKSEISSIVLVVFILLPLCGVAAAYGLQRTNRNRQFQAVKFRKQYALQKALQELNRVSFSDNRAAFEAIHLILRNYAADKLNLELVDTRRISMRTILSSPKVPKLAAEKLNSLIIEIEEGQFAPSVQEISRMWADEFKKSLTTIDHLWEMP